MAMVATGAPSAARLTCTEGQGRSAPYVHVHDKHTTHENLAATHIHCNDSLYGIRLQFMSAPPYGRLPAEGLPLARARMQGAMQGAMPGMQGGMQGMQGGMPGMQGMQGAMPGMQGMQGGMPGMQGSLLRRIHLWV